MKIAVKRVYDPAAGEDGYRALVDRLWPRGLKKSSAAIDEWAKELAPSASLRQWFNHEPEKWQDFRRRYKDELKENNAVPAFLERVNDQETVTLLYAAHDDKHNHALVLQRYLKSKSKK